MRYDDMLATVLGQPQRDGPGRLRIWRQIVDLLAQGRAAGSDEAVVERAYAFLQAVRGEVPFPVRAAIAADCANARVPAALIAFFAEDAPEIAGPLLSVAMLDGPEWMEILPELSVFAKGQLRARDDLPEELAYALGVALDNYEGGHQISDLLSRIQAFRNRPEDEPAEPAESASIAPASIIPASITADPPVVATATAQLNVTMDSFRFTVDETGLLIPRGPLLDGIEPLTIAAVAENPDHGVDSHAAGAWRRRAAFSDARLAIAGDAPGAGQWRISAEPCFAAPDGRFVGYAGEARRSRVEEALPPVAAPVAPVATNGQAKRIELLRAALRGPLDTIGRLAVVSPRPPITMADAALPSTDHDTAIVDLALPGQPPIERRLDAGTILARMHAAYQPEMDARGVQLSFRIAADLPPIAADPAEVERMFARLLAAILGIAQSGECVAVRVGRDRRDGALVAVSLSRPGPLMGLDEHMLLGGALEAGGDFPDAPRLALSFAIRLVRNLAIEAGGRLDIAADRFILALPLAEPRSAAERQG